MTRPLFDQYPQLAQQLPVEELADLPTPVAALDGLGDKAWIKRDDLTHAAYGGNKIRKLEFILAEAQSQGKTHIVSFGAIGTNHGVATAMLCQQLGLGCTLLLFDQPLTDTVRSNLRQMAYYGAQLRYCGSLAATVAAFYLHPRRLHPRSYFLFAGGSNTAGTLGFVNAAFELQQQIQAGQCPQPDTIIVPVGSAATLAGLSIGVAAAGLGSRVHGVRVAPSHLGPFAACTPETVARLVRQTRRRLATLGVQVPDSPPPLLDERYYGTGYGEATAAGSAAQARFADCGVQLEQTYTAKAGAAFLDALADASGPLLYWHTFNSRKPPDMPADMPLPPALRRVLAQECAGNIA